MYNTFYIIKIPNGNKGKRWPFPPFSGWFDLRKLLLFLKAVDVKNRDACGKSFRLFLGDIKKSSAPLSC
jgi:hypothetical protein